MARPVENCLPITEQAYRIYCSYWPNNWRMRRAFPKGDAMSRIDDLKAEIERLPSEEFTELFRWLSEKDWEKWDNQIVADSQAGRLDFLIREAREEKAKGRLKDL